MRRLAAILLLVIAGLAIAQEFTPPQTPEDLFGVEEVLYGLLVMPLVQLLKARRPFSSLLEAMGERRRYGVYTLSLLVGIALALLAQFTGIFDYGSIREAVSFGIGAGLVNSGLKQLMNDQTDRSTRKGVQP